MDVCILREACLKFREIFLNIANVCPFSEAVTLAGACSVVYRKNYLKVNIVRLIPPGGYRKANKHSKISIEWLVYEEKKLEGEKILHARRGREHYIPQLGAHVDGFRETPESKIVYQFHGCYFHGHNCPQGSKNEQLYAKTLKSDSQIRELGYELIVMWECEFNQLKEENKFLFKHLLHDNELLYADVFSPRDSFFGGRTGNVEKYYDVSNTNEKSHYIDICALYPSV